MAHRSSSKQQNTSVISNEADTKKADRGISYHGADEVHKVVREVIGSYSAGGNMLMSAKIMVGILGRSGLSDAMAKRLYSQIRKGAPLYAEWRDAFACGRFLQEPGGGGGNFFLLLGCFRRPAVSNE